MIAVLCLGKAREENKESHQSLDPSDWSCGLRDNKKERRVRWPSPLPFILGAHL